MSEHPELPPESPADQSASAAPIQPELPALGDAPPGEPDVAPIPTQHERYLRLAARWMLVGLALYGVVWLLGQAQSALTPFIIGLVLAYLLLPLVNRLSHRMPRWAAILLVYIGLAAAAAISIAFIIPPAAAQIGQLIQSRPSVEEIEQMAADLLLVYRTSVPDDLRQPIDQAAASALRAVQNNITTYAQSVGGFLVGRLLQIVNTVIYVVGLLIIPIWLFYVMNDQARGTAAINTMIHPRARADFWHIWSIINAVLSNYVRGQLILGLAVALAAGAGLLALGLFGIRIPYILLLAIVAGITELIPIVGPIVGAVPAVLLGFTISPGAGLAVLALYILIQQLENNVLVPRIVGESIGLHPAVLSVVLIAMGQVFGIIGVILSAPVTAIVRDLFIYIYERLKGAQPDTARAAVREYARGEQPVAAS